MASDREPTAAARSRWLATALAATAGDPELVAAIVTIELIARMANDTREPVLMALTAAEPDGVLDIAMGCL